LSRKEAEIKRSSFSRPPRGTGEGSHLPRHGGRRKPPGRVQRFPSPRELSLLSGIDREERRGKEGPCTVSAGGKIYFVGRKDSISTTAKREREGQPRREKSAAAKRAISSCAPGKKASGNREGKRETKTQGKGRPEKGAPFSF